MVNFYSSIKASNDNFRYPVRCSSLALRLIFKKITFSADMDRLHFKPLQVLLLIDDILCSVMFDIAFANLSR